MFRVYVGGGQPGRKNLNVSRRSDNELCRHSITITRSGVLDESKSFHQISSYCNRFTRSKLPLGSDLTDFSRLLMVF